MRMRLHGLRQLVDDKTVAIVNRFFVSDCQNLLPTGLLQVVSTNFNRSEKDQLQQA